MAQTDSGILVLPHEIKPEFLSEGAANVVYRLLLPNSRQSSPHTSADLYDEPGATPGSTTPPPSSITPPPLEDKQDPYNVFRGKLLRLHKQVDWIPSYKSLHENHANVIVPLFSPTNLVQQQLVLLPPGLLASLNEDLTNASTRSKQRSGIPLALDEPYGLLITDMSADRATSQVLVELKPKWLAQSPNAPSDARRCRTCALRAQRRAMKKADPSTAHPTGFCPLDLISQDPAAIAQSTACIVANAAATAQLPDPAKQIVRQKLQRFFMTSALLPRLREVQIDKDPHGVLGIGNIDAASEDFLIATTVRDCTLFLRLTTLDEGADAGVEARLGDLDLKAPEPGKLRHWRETERVLVDEGWYMGGRSGDDDGGEAETCRLGRTG